MVLCSRCGKARSVIKLRYLGETLCKNCFVEFFEEKVIKALKDAGVLDNLSGKLVAVGVSGGKDSSNTLYVLNKLKEYFDFDLVGVCIDEGIVGYRDVKLKFLRNLCLSLGVELVEVKMEREMGISIDEVYRLRREKKIELNPCGVCGVYRRYLLNRAARDLGADFVATGHNLDDEVQTLFINIFRGNYYNIAREGLYTVPIAEDLVPRIKPLYYTYEKESMVYFLLNKMYTPRVECPYAPESERYYLRTWLNELELREPGTKWRILMFKMRLREKLLKVIPPPKLRKCDRCGQSTPNILCRACEIRVMIERALS